MSRILQSQSLFGQIISRSCFTRVGFWSTKYPLTEAAGKLCGSCGINGTHHTPIPNKFKNGFMSAQSLKLHTTSSTHSEESQQDEKRGEVDMRNNSNEGRKETVIDRLRRLSETPADVYELSQVAQEKAKQMAQLREESMRNGEDWKWDQRNVRPGGFPPQNRNRYERNDDDFDGYGGGGGRQQGYNNNRGFDRYNNRSSDDFYGYSGGRQQGYNNNRNRGFDRYENERDEEEFDSHDLTDRRSWRDRPPQQRQQQYSQRKSNEFDDVEPQDYEQEMEKLRVRLEKTKAEKQRLQTKKPSMASEDSDARSTEASKS